MRTRALGRLAIADVERRSRGISREIEARGEVLIGDEPGYVTVDVPRSEQRPLPLADLLPASTGKHAPGSLEFIAGVAPSGEIRVADLARLACGHCDDGHQGLPHYLLHVDQCDRRFGNQLQA
jgi:hypothetical protein